MEAGLTAGVDWRAPWFRTFADPGQVVAKRWEAGEALSSALAAGGQAPVRFVPQSVLPEGEPYEAFIRRTGQCPTRENLHDFFNGLCWRAFPKAKAQLNLIQSVEIAREGIGAVRGRVRDAATVFDENGATLHAPPAVWEALLARDWQRLFVDLRPLWSGVQVTVFGHALLEKLVQPRKDLTAHVWCTDVPADPVRLDEALAKELTPERLATKPFTPLPVLGVPGWWRENENFSFYDDSLVFRPAGQKNQAHQSRAAPRLN